MRGILTKKFVHLIGGAWRRWHSATVITRGIEKQSKVAKLMANQLVETKDKLLRLKSQLRAGGFLPALAAVSGLSITSTQKRGNRINNINDNDNDNDDDNENENGAPSPTESNASSNFCWDISDEEEDGGDDTLRLTVSRGGEEAQYRNY